MNYIYAIIILVLILALLEFGQRYLRQQKENFSNLEKFENPNSKIYFEENALVNFGDNITGSAVNIRQPYRSQIGTFGTSGIRPSYIGLANPDTYAGGYMKCPSCELQFDCSNYPYEVDAKHGAVCTNCIEKKMYNEFNLPVYAKSIGSPRKCRDLLHK
jgi:hypothetical protein